MNVNPINSLREYAKSLLMREPMKDPLEQVVDIILGLQENVLSIANSACKLAKRVNEMETRLQQLESRMDWHMKGHAKPSVSSMN